jgi:hypothetical protein
MTIDPKTLGPISGYRVALLNQELSYSFVGHFFGVNAEVNSYDRAFFGT